MLEHLEEPDRKNSLLEAALSRDVNKYPKSVAERAARELVRYDDPDLANTLEKLGTYGSEYAVLATKSKHLSLREKIEL